MQNPLDLNWTLRSLVPDEGAGKQEGHLEDVEIVITLLQPNPFSREWLRIDRNRSSPLFPPFETDGRARAELVVQFKTSLVRSSDPPFL